MSEIEVRDEHADLLGWLDLSPEYCGRNLGEVLKFPAWAGGPHFSELCLTVERVRIDHGQLNVALKANRQDLPMLRGLSRFTPASR